MADVSETQAVEWLAGIAAGDKQSLAAFYRGFEQRVYAFALKRLSDPTDAADVLNDVMMQVWRTADRFEGRSKVSTWLLGIANHKVLDRLRQRGRQPDSLDDDNQHCELVDDNAASGFSLIQNAEHAGFVRRCMERLNDFQRQVVHLTFFEELSYPEIAEVLACPAGTVKTRMFHAKKVLFDCLQSLVGDGDPEPNAG